jgi:hypothetical protein
MLFFDIIPHKDSSFYGYEPPNVHPMYHAFAQMSAKFE